MADPASVTYEQFLSAAATLRVPAARLLLVYWTNSWLFLNRHEDNAEHSTNMQCMHQQHYKFAVYQLNTQDNLFLLQPCMEIVFYCHFEKALI